jgi:hypothetical protein
MSSRKRRLVTPQQPDEKRRTDRIVVDVGGTRFTTSASTLTSASEYFERLLSPRWCAEPPEELFLDRDPEPFKILLTYMRTGLLELSKDDESLARRVMIEAEFLGMVGLVESIKATCHKNIFTLHSGSDESAAERFTKNYGSFDAAIRSGQLPGLYFGRPNAPAETNIVQVMPAPPGTRVEIHCEDREHAARFDVLCFALHDKPKRLKDGDYYHESALDAYVACGSARGTVMPRLASEAYDRVTRYKFYLPKPKEDNVTEIPEGVLQAEFWTDKDDHEAGTHSHPVRMIRGGCTAGTPVELVQGDPIFGHPTVHWQPLSAYNNFKGYQGGG